MHILVLNLWFHIVSVSGHTHSHFISKFCQTVKNISRISQFHDFFYLQVKPLIWIESVIERHAHSRIEFMVKAKSQFKRRSTANNVEIIIPVPNDADSPKFKTTIGHCKYEPETQSIKWTIKSFPGKFWFFFLYFSLN
jgi:hypothetical protein